MDCQFAISHQVKCPMLSVPHDLKLHTQAEDPCVVRSVDEIESILNTAGLRPTRQRITLGALLFLGEHRHVMRDDLHREALNTGASLSLATVYNALSQFADARPLCRFAVDGTRTHFDTDACSHLPVPPEGCSIPKVDVVIRLKRIQPHPDANGIAPRDDATASAQPALVDALLRLSTRRHSN
jgi:Fur family iron response transcriptional regulator